MSKKHTGTVIAFGMPRPVALELVRKLVIADQFALVPKAKMNLSDRDFTMRQVLIALKEGQIDQGPRRDESNDWRCRIKKKVAGRIVRVVVAIHDETFVYVISVH
jgi:hypothetical protein